MTSRKMPIVLSIAGSDSAGGAGIQADIKTIEACGAHAMTALTCATAQTHAGVTAVEVLPLGIIRAQLVALFEQYPIASVKTGMLFSAEIITLVAEILAQFQPAHIVVDPVMVARSGDLLITPAAVSAYKEALFPLATVITPNRHEANVLLGKAPETTWHKSRVEAEKEALLAASCADVILKNIREGDSIFDALITEKSITYLSSAKAKTANTHGTGCSHSSAIAAFLVLGKPLQEAAETAKKYVSAGLENPKEIAFQGADLSILNHRSMS